MKFLKFPTSIIENRKVKSQGTFVKSISFVLPCIPETTVHMSTTSFPPWKGYYPRKELLVP